VKTLIIYTSFHRMNTQKVPKVTADVPHAIIKGNDVQPDELVNYNLVDFGSGIYGRKHRKDLLTLVDARLQ